MVRKEYELIAKGIWTERCRDKVNCLEVVWDRNEMEDDKK